MTEGAIREGGGPATYVWEPTSEELAVRTGLPAASIVRFDMNSAPAAPALAAGVLAAAFEPPLNEYPPSDYARLVAAAADAYGVGRDEILPAAGADEALDLTARAYLRQDETAVAASPTYAMYRVVTEQRGARLLDVPRLPRQAGFGLDEAALRAVFRGAPASDRPRLLWLCEPNNPTGAVEPPEKVAMLLEGLAADAAGVGVEPPLVVVDEAYAEFVGSTVLSLRASYPRLVVIRTLSKAYGLAGIRVGFAIARPETLAPIVAYRAPSSVSTPSAAVAAAALRRRETMTANVAAIVAERRRLARGLMDAGWRPAPSEANFLLVRFGSPDAADRVAGALLARGLVVRTFAAGHPCGDSLRITVRSEAEDDRLIDAAREIPR